MPSHNLGNIETHREEIFQIGRIFCEPEVIQNCGVNDSFLAAWLMGSPGFSGFLLAASLICTLSLITSV